MLDKIGSIIVDLENVISVIEESEYIVRLTRIQEMLIELETDIMNKK